MAIWQWHPPCIEANGSHYFLTWPNYSEKQIQTKIYCVNSTTSTHEPKFCRGGATMRAIHVSATYHPPLTPRCQRHQTSHCPLGCPHLGCDWADDSGEKPTPQQQQQQHWTGTGLTTGEKNLGWNWADDWDVHTVAGTGLTTDVNTVAGTGLDRNLNQ